MWCSMYVPTKKDKCNHQITVFLQNIVNCHVQMNFQIHSCQIIGLFISIYKPVLLMEVHSVLFFWYELLNISILSQSLKYEDTEFYIQYINTSDHTLIIQD
jgi:hypothetical protein